MSDRRLLIPILAGVVIAGVSVWRVRANKTQDYADQVKAAVLMRPVSLFRGEFEGLDSDNRLVRLGGLLGRHRIILVFFDGEAGADKDAGLLLLRERFEELKAASVKVIAVSMALPQQNRAAMGEDRVGPFPFPIISDIDPTGMGGAMQIHIKWGRVDPETNVTRPAVFYIDRKGEVWFGRSGPVPVTAEEAIAFALK